MSIGTYNIGYRFSEKIYGGPVRGELWPNDNDFFLPMIAALERTLSRIDRAIAISNEKWFCFMRPASQPVFILFISHAVDTHKITKFNGLARSFWCGTIQELLLLYQADLNIHETYQLYGVEKTRHQQRQRNRVKAIATKMKASKFYVN